MLPNQNVWWHVSEVKIPEIDQEDSLEARRGCVFTSTDPLSSLLLPMYIFYVSLGCPKRYCCKEFSAHCRTYGSEEPFIRQLGWHSVTENHILHAQWNDCSGQQVGSCTRWATIFASQSISQSSCFISPLFESVLYLKSYPVSFIYKKKLKETLRFLSIINTVNNN